MSSDDQSAKSARVDDSSRDVEKAIVETQRQQPGQTVRTTTSKAYSVVLTEIVHRSERRGLLGKLSIIPEVTNPYSYSPAIKWWMTVIVSFAAITSSTGSSIFYRKETPANIRTGRVTRNLSTNHELQRPCPRSPEIFTLLPPWPIYLWRCICWRWLLPRCGGEYTRNISLEAASMDLADLTTE